MMPIDNSGENLIFLVSQPRAGSTLLQRVLAGHPEIHTTAEPWIMLPLLYSLRNEGIHTEYNQALAVSAVNDFLISIDMGKPAYLQATGALAANIYQQACTKAGKTIFLDKTPRYYLILDELYQLFPGAKFSLLFRHPLAVLHSILDTRVKGNWLLLQRYRLDLLSAPKNLILAKNNFKHRTITINYEQFVKNPEHTAKQLFEFLNLSYSSSYLNYGGIAGRPAGQLGDQSTINRYSRPVTQRINRWHQLREHPQTRHFALEYLDQLGESTLAHMGYSANEAQQILKTDPQKAQKLAIYWKDIFAEKSPYQERIFYSEFALLEHRRLVFAVKKLLRRIGIS